MGCKYKKNFLINKVIHRPKRATGRWRPPCHESPALSSTFTATFDCANDTNSEIKRLYLYSSFSERGAWHTYQRRCFRSVLSENLDSFQKQRIRSTLRSSWLYVVGGLLPALYSISDGCGVQIVYFCFTQSRAFGRIYEMAPHFCCIDIRSIGAWSM